MSGSGYLHEQLNRHQETEQGQPNGAPNAAIKCLVGARACDIMIWKHEDLG